MLIGVDFACFSYCDAEMEKTRRSLDLSMLCSRPRQRMYDGGERGGEAGIFSLPRYPLGKVD